MKIIGKVQPGKSRGRELGFRTLNIDVPELDLDDGIYVTAVNIRGKDYESVSHFGPRPTFDDDAKILEVHVFDFDQDVYGEEVEVDFLLKLRDVLKFDTKEELIEQISKDILLTKEFFKLRQL